MSLKWLSPVLNPLNLSFNKRTGNQQFQGTFCSGCPSANQTSMGWISNTSITSVKGKMLSFMLLHGSNCNHRTKQTSITLPGTAMWRWKENNRWFRCQRPPTFLWGDTFLSVKAQPIETAIQYSQSFLSHLVFLIFKGRAKPLHATIFSEMLEKPFSSR